MVNRDTNYWRAFMSPYLKVNYFKGVCSLESIPICLGITTCQATCFAVVLKFECKKYSVVAVWHGKVLLRGHLLLLQSLETFRFYHENVSRSLNCKSFYIMLAIVVYVNRGSVLDTKIMLKWMDLPPKHGTWEFAIVEFFIVVHVILLAWDNLLKRNSGSHPFEKHSSTRPSLLVLHRFIFVAIFHRKMVNRGNVRDAKVLIKWKVLPLKHDTCDCSSLRTRMFE
jgi:hypothetical protein